MTFGGHIIYLFYGPNSVNFAQMEQGVQMMLLGTHKQYTPQKSCFYHYHNCRQ